MDEGMSEVANKQQMQEIFGELSKGNGVPFLEAMANLEKEIDMGRPSL